MADPLAAAPARIGPARPGARARLASIAPRAAGTVSPGRRLAVRVLKRLLPAAAVLLLAAIALWPQIDGSDDQRRLTFRRDGEAAPDTLRVRQARYQGVDELGRPFTVTAREASQVSGRDAIEMVQPQADMTLQDGAWVFLDAAEGTYRRTAGLLELAGGVTLNHDAGYEVRTPTAQVDLRAQSAEGPGPVAAQGPFGTLEGIGFQATDGGREIIVFGPARLVLEGQK